MSARRRSGGPTRPQDPARPPRFITLLLRLLPTDFRQRFGANMERDLGEDWSEARHRGKGARLRFWSTHLVDLLLTVPREHVAGLGLDLRTTLRTLRRQPLFTAIAVLSLAIGIGAATSVLAVFDATFGRGIPGATHGDRLVNVKLENALEDSFSLTSYPTWVDLRASGVLEDLAGFSGMRMSFVSNEIGTSDGTPELLGVQAVTSNYFSVLGVEPALGRLLDLRDEQQGLPVVVLSHHLWQERYAASPDLVGQTIRLNGAPFTVVGVAAPDFRGHFIGFNFDAFITVAMEAKANLPSRSDRSRRWIEMVGLRPENMALEQIETQFQVEAERLTAAWPDVHRGLGITVERCDGHDADLRGGLKAFIAILASVSGLILLIGCVNVANLMLGRLVQRRHELELRTALGASRSRLARPLVLESTLLALLAGTLGTCLAYAASRLASRNLPGLGGVQVDVAVDLPILVGALGISLATALVFGLLPALSGSRTLSANSARSALSRSPQRSLRPLLVVAQVALSAVLLIAAGLFLRALERAAALDPGFDPRHVWQVPIDPRLAGMAPEEGQELFDRALEQVRALPGVEHTSLVNAVPLSLGARFFSKTIRIDLPGVAPPPDQDGWQVEHAAVSPGYHETLRIPRLAGRDFDASDVAAARRDKEEPDADRRGVVLVNETFIERFFGASTPYVTALGSTLEVDGRAAEIVGVVANSRYRTLDEEPTAFVYVLFGRGSERRTTLLVRASPRTSVTGQLRDWFHDQAPNLPLSELGTLEDQLEVSFLPQRIAGTVAGALGLVGLFLTAVGLYGVLSRSVSARTAEIGVRMSLGASPRAVLVKVLRSAVALATAGLITGLALALVVSQGITAFLYGLGAFDLWAYGAIAGLLLLVSVAAAWVPARRAAKIDVMRALRAE